MSARKSLDVHTEGDVVIATLSGEIDLSNARAIGSVVGGGVSNDAVALILDLSEVTYLDSSGVHLIFDLAQRLGGRQQKLVLIVPAGSKIRRVLDLVNLEAVVPIAPEVEAAKAAARA
jgi:anti-sigma B factor antagonist